MSSICRSESERAIVESARHHRPRILIPSIGDPVRPVNGASAYTRELDQWLHSPPLAAETRFLPLPRLPPVRHRLRQASSITRSLLSKLPSKLIFARRRQMAADVRREIDSGRYDLVLLNGTDLLWLLDELPDSIPRAVIAHNIEHRLFGEQLRSAGWLLTQVRRPLARDARRLGRYELAGMERARNLITLSAQDAAYAEQHCPGLHTLVLPPAFGYPPCPRRPPPRDGELLQVGFLGNFGWWPNRQALSWFLERVFPQVNGIIHLHLFGEHAGSGAWPENVTAHGYVPEIAEVFGRCHFMICPVLGGGGVSIKAAEAIYNRVPILATPFGVRGLPLAEDPAIVIRQSPKDWVDFIASPAALEFAAVAVLEINSRRFLSKHRKSALESYVLRVMGRAARPLPDGVLLSRRP